MWYNLTKSGILTNISEYFKVLNLRKNIDKFTRIAWSDRIQVYTFFDIFFFILCLSVLIQIYIQMILSYFELCKIAVFDSL